MHDLKNYSTAIRTAICNDSNGTAICNDSNGGFKSMV